jgi:pentatricopeptide repeat protein
MKFLMQSISGRNRSLVRALVSRRYFASSPEEIAKRNYANDLSEYNTAVNSVTAQRRHYLLRDVYDDMKLDGVQPTADIFHSFVVGTMKGARLSDAFFFREEMKAMGIAPDVNLYNFLISTCGKCKNGKEAIRVYDEMKRYDVKPNGQTFVCLLNACAVSGQLDLV